MTTYTPGKTYSNFTLLRQEEIAELHSTVYQFRHEQLGCQAFAIKNEDPNKTFCIAFKTVPEDSTGVAHILEHSVLMGSRKYPVHDVFGEINKGGLTTFLNAMTGADTTWYPFATRNRKEYFNIMDVYCDVTLNPLLQQTTFEQEGWHVHLENMDDQLVYSGVVLNEMRGAYADPIRSLFHLTFKALIPDSTYAHESGGDPARIPDLSYDQFVRFHQDHYHPSNATLFFYGNGTLEEELAFVQDNFLHHFPTPVQPATILEGTPITAPTFVEEVYPVQAESELEQKTFLAVSSIVGTAPDRKLNTTFQIIANILFNSDASPLKQAILEARLCRDFGGLFLGTSSYTTFMMTYLVGSDPDKGEQFMEIYRDTLATMVSQRLDRDLILSELNKFEFSSREEMNKAQRGLDLIGKALPAMKYELDPFSALQMEALLAEIRRDALEHHLIEDLIQTHLLDNPATAMVTLRPDPDKLQVNAREERQRLEKIEEGLNQTEREQLVQRTQELIRLQSTPPSAESLKLLPRLAIQDLEPQPFLDRVSVEQLGPTPLLISELDTNGICYLDFGLDCSSLPVETLPYLDLFATLVTELGTSTKDYIQFTKEVNLYTGGFNHSFNTYPMQDPRETVRPIQWFHLKTLSANLERGLELLAEVFAEVDFSNRQRIREIVQREFAWAEHGVQSEGYSLASTRVFSHLSMAGKYNEYTQGVHAYLKLKELASRYEALEEEFLTAIATIARALFRRQGSLVAITADRDDISRFQGLSPAVLQTLPETSQQAGVPCFQQMAANQALCTSAEVVYNVQGCTLFPDVSQYGGSFEVLKTWLSRDYFWNSVRQKGGAYGCFIQFNHLTGNFGVVSYRDPQVDRTFAAYDSLEQVVSGMSLTKDMLSQLVIGTYGNFTPHQGPASRGATARNDYLSGVTPEFRQQRIEEIIRTDQEQLRSYGPLFSRFREQAYRATIGSQEKIQAATTPFDETLTL
ncbi:insulinase family protein [Desulfogranum mediterraneum]|uniref:insulinase family protein n=1 Tax=Desulfogranum mediterraneum TaxID=160661 RepID=UPI000421F2FB|nr:insulinase family protein [Desulfogranum mediterraneum]